MCPHSETGSLHRWVKMMPLDIYMFVLFVWLRCVACRILVPLPGTEPMPLQWKHQVLATRPRGKHQNDIFRLDSTLIRLVLLFKKKKKKTGNLSTEANPSRAEMMQRHPGTRWPSTSQEEGPPSPQKEPILPTSWFRLQASKTMRQ